jgi:hypothetical protein
MGLACSATGNWNHGTSGPSRYAVWLTPLVLRIALDVLGLGAGARRWAVALCGAAIVAQAAVVFARGGLAGRDDSGEHSYLARWVLECRPSLYQPPAEVFAARTLRVGGGEGPSVYATGGRCRKALAQKRHAELLRELCGHEPPAFTRFQQSIAREGRGRDAWTYVDY